MIPFQCSMVQGGHGRTSPSRSTWRLVQNETEHLQWVRVEETPSDEKRAFSDCINVALHGEPSSDECLCDDPKMELDQVQSDLNTVRLRLRRLVLNVDAAFKSYAYDRTFQSLLVESMELNLTMLKMLSSAADICTHVSSTTPTWEALETDRAALSSIERVRCATRMRRGGWGRAAPLQALRADRIPDRSRARARVEQDGSHRGFHTRDSRAAIEIRVKCGVFMCIPFNFGSF